MMKIEHNGVWLLFSVVAILLLISCGGTTKQKVQTHKKVHSGIKKEKPQVDTDTVANENLDTSVYRPFDNDVCRIQKNYVPTFKGFEKRDLGIGVFLDLEIPKGNSKKDRTMRQWLLDEIKNRIFLVFDTELHLRTHKVGNTKQFKKALNKYGKRWEKAFRDEFTDEEGPYETVNSHIKTRKVMEDNNFMTWRFESNYYPGGARDYTYIYYATFDKNRNCIIDGNNTVKASKKKEFCRLLVNSMKAQFFKTSREDDEWKEFGENVNDYGFPHLAVIPQGVIVSYASEVIDYNWAGQYDAVVPLDKAFKCLKLSTNNK